MHIAHICSRISLISFNNMFTHLERGGALAEKIRKITFFFARAHNSSNDFVSCNNSVNGEKLQDFFYKFTNTNYFKKFVGI